MNYENKPHLNEQQLADRWGMSIRTLQDWRRRGIGISYLKLRGMIRYQIETIERYEAAHLKEVQVVIEEPVRSGFMNEQAVQNERA